MPGTSIARLPLLTIRGIRTSAVDVPMKFPLGTSGSTVHSTPLLLIDLETEEGITGRTFLFCYRRSVPRAIDVVLQDAVSVVKWEPVAPLDVGAKLARRFALVGVWSVVRMALSGLDAELWDALAVGAGLPLATFLGAKPKPIPAYNSSGLGIAALGKVDIVINNAGGNMPQPIDQITDEGLGSLRRAESIELHGAHAGPGSSGERPEVGPRHSHFVNRSQSAEILRTEHKL